MEKNIKHKEILCKKKNMKCKEILCITFINFVFHVGNLNNLFLCQCTQSKVYHKITINFLWKPKLALEMEVPLPFVLSSETKQYAI